MSFWQNPLKWLLNKLPMDESDSAGVAFWAARSDKELEAALKEMGEALYNNRPKDKTDFTVN